MSRVLKLTVICFCIAGLASSAFGAANHRMFWVPLADGDPTNFASGTTFVFASQGDTVTMGVYYQGPDGTDFGSTGVQAFVDSVGTQIGAGVTSGSVSADCTVGTSIFIDQGRGDYVGFNTTTLAGSECAVAPFKLGWVLLNIPVSAATIPGAPDGVYIGQVDYVVSADACGRFLFDYVGPPDLETIILNDSNQAILDAIFDPLVIVVEPQNDLCADATNLPESTPTAYDTACGAQDGPTPSCGAAGADVWFEYTVTCDAAAIRFTNTGGADFAVYDDGCAATSEVACNGDYEPGGVVPTGTVLTIQLIGDDTSGTFEAVCESACTPGQPAGSALTVSECGPPATPNDDPCLLWYCNDDPGVGALGCIAVSTDPNDPGNTTDGNACDDGQFCLVDDQCLGGVCEGQADRDCSDGALCTVDECDEDADQCVNTDINTIPCTTIADCPAAASECSAEGFCVCVENPALCLNVETQEGKNCLDGVGVGDEVIVTVDMAFSTAPICAAQFFLSYDNAALDFNSITPGGGIFNTVLLENVDEGAGTIDYIVGENPGAICFGTNGPATIATISFTAIAECKNEGVCFRPHNPPTILGAADGSSICPLGHLRPSGDDYFGYGECGLEDNPLADPCCTGPFSVDVTPPTINCPDFKTFGNADCGTVTRTVFWDPLFAVDNCDGSLPVDCTISHNGGADVSHLLNGGAFPPGVTTIDCGSTSDSCNNASECVFSVGNSGLNGLHVEVELSPTMDAGPLVRGIDFSVSDCGSIANPEPIEVCADVTFGFPFNIPGHGVAQAKIPPGNWLCIEADDPLHTLNATCDVTCEVLPEKGSTWFASFKGSKDLSDTCHWLVNGNLNGDIHIDVLDYVTYLACVANDPNPGADSPCGTEGPHCDINGDGLVSLLDFSFILVNLFNDSKAGCDAVCNPAATPQVVDATESISVRQLIADGVDSRVARSADVNNDGTVDVSDMALYLQNGGETRDVVRDQSIKGTRGVRGLR